MVNQQVANKKIWGDRRGGCILVARGIVEASPPEEPQVDDLAEPGFVEGNDDDRSGYI
jgi:hypothetical protein